MNGPDANDPAALLEAAIASHAAGRYAEAERFYRNILVAHPAIPEVHYNLALALRGQGHLDAAEQALARAIALRPAYAEALTALGNVQQVTGRSAAAIESYRKALILKPDSAAIHNHLGTALRSCQRFHESVQHLETATQLRPDSAEALFNLATSLLEVGRVSEAVAGLRQALAMSPGNPATLTNLANALKEEGNLPEAIACCRTALAIDPSLELVQHNLLLFLTYQCSDPAELFGAHRDWARRWADALAPSAPSFRSTPDPGRRLRVGYVSPDFYTHPVGIFFEPLLSAHSPAVETYCYAEDWRTDGLTEVMRRACDHWKSIRGMSDDTAAELVRQDQIDILVDLAGHTAHNRLGLFARRPAPLQMNWLGSSATTGMAAIDYRITDSVADPPGAEAYNSETLLRLPSGFYCYRPLEETPPVAPLPAATGEPITFGSFNTFGKLTPETVTLWGRILQDIPNSRLLLKSKQARDPRMVDKLRGEFSRHGVEPERVQFAPVRALSWDHLATYHAVDIGLDPIPYNGATTSCDALWMGIPVVALRGSTHAGRVCASYLTHLGLADLIAETTEQYVAIARQLSADLPRLAELRAGLRERMRRHMGDPVRFAQEIEAAYRAIWKNWCGK